MSDKIKIAVIGQGYVGLPLAVQLGKKYLTIGYDNNKKKILELKKNIDISKEVTVDQIKKSKNLTFSSKINEIRSCNYYIVAVPTPINKKKNLV